jgi:hypothetical protein
MPFTQWMPLVAAAAVVSFFVVVGARTETRLPWQLPAAVSATFLAFSLVAVFTEGGMGFWPVHTHNLWGNQRTADTRGGGSSECTMLYYFNLTKLYTNHICK